MGLRFNFTGAYVALPNGAFESAERGFSGGIRFSQSEMYSHFCKSVLTKVNVFSLFSFLRNREEGRRRQKPLSEGICTR